jgi:putative PIN family toxin of toxin-antitoxin system
MQRIVLDTNIYISAILTSGKPRAILDLVREKKFRLFISEDILNEIERVLHVKMGLDDFDITNTLNSIIEISSVVIPEIRISKIENDASDNIILECAVEASADCIVSGDKHLLSLTEYQGIVILNPSEFLYLI